MDASSVGILFLMWIASSVLAAYVASENERNPWVWFAISLFFSPLISLLALAGLPKGEIPAAKEHGVSWKGF